MPLKPITLIGEQKRVLFLPHTNPIQIKGSAGSGKTTVALYRAKHLIDTYTNLFHEPDVVIFTFNQSLMKYIGELLPSVTGGYHENSETITASVQGLTVSVTTFHKWAYQFLRAKGVWLNNTVAIYESQDACILNALTRARSSFPSSTILNKGMEFFRDEFSWIKGKMFTNESEYVEAARTGMGTKDRVTKDDKRILWTAFSGYQQALDAAHLLDFDDFALKSLRLTESDPSYPPPFTHIVIDEAQDLNKAQMSVIKRLVHPDTNSITVIADAAQRIYKSGFSWAEVGINIKGGRTIEFKKNYRNTLEIAQAANSLLLKENDREEFTSADTAQIRTHGDKPVIAHFGSPEAGLQYAATQIRNIDLSSETVVFLHRYRRSLYWIAAGLCGKSIAAEVIKKSFNDFSKESVKVCTLSSIKGLEFDHVFILDVNENVIPYPEGFSEPNDQYHISTERRLLYTAMTRARKKLYLIATGTPSRYLSEIDATYVQIVRGIEVSCSAPEDAPRNDDDLPF